MPRLKMLRGPEPGTEIELEEDEVRIGRGRRNHIVIQDNEVSRYHCRLIRVLDDYEIHDMKSTNGVFVNGQKVGAGGWLLSQRLIIELGDSITFEYLPSEISMGTNVPANPNGAVDQPDSHYFVVKQEDVDQPDIYLLDRISISIGRDVDNDIILQEPEVSRHHVKLTLDPAGYQVEDLGTLNGTFVNETQVVGQRILSEGDMISIGTKLKIWYTHDPDALVDQLRNGGSIPIKREDSTARSGRSPLKADEKDKMTQMVEAVDALSIDTSDLSADVGHGLAMHELEETVFLAYARDEWQDVAGGLFDYLHQNGIEVWADQYLQPDTVDWVEAIEQAQAESNCLVAIVSEKSLRTPYVQRSVRHFLAREKPVILIQYGDIKRKPMMLQNIEAIKFDDTDPTRSFRLILAALNDLNKQRNGN